MKRPCFLAIFLLLVRPAKAESPWFRPTPLEPALRALLQQNPQRAWQELLAALNGVSLDPAQWQPIKHAILSRSECGQRLITADHIPPITLTLISRTGHSSSSYQLKLSMEDAEQDGQLKLIAPNGEELIQANMVSGQFYQEWETRDLFIKPQPGLYQLSFSGQSVSLLLSDYDTSDWLARDRVEPNLLNTYGPNEKQTCHPLQVSLQWFDNQYHQVGERMPLAINQSSIQLPANLNRAGAQYLSASALLYEYQANIRIEYIQRVTLTDALHIGQ